MKRLYIVIALLVSGCVIALPPIPTTSNMRNPNQVQLQTKPFGPDVKSLNNDQLSWFNTQCKLYTNMADPRIVYDYRYCLMVDNERNARSLNGKTLPYTAMKDWYRIK